MNKKILGLGLFTLLGFGFTGLVLVHFFQESTLEDLFTRGLPWFWQVILGLMVGGLAAIIAKWIIKRPFFEKQHHYYHQLINQWNWGQERIIFISLCAGVGEELFFRAGLQPLLGLWLTSLLFVLIHGYLNPYDWRISVYGMAMVLIIAVFGWLFEITGIFTAVAAHAVFDWVLLTWMTKNEKAHE
jgi:uncharacterized protein